MTLADCYMATLIVFLQLLAPAVFFRLSMKTDRKEPLAPIEFAQALLGDQSWPESRGSCARDMLSKCVPRSAEALHSTTWCANVKRVFAALGSVCAHEEADNLRDTFGPRNAGEVRPLALVSAGAN